MNDVFPKIEDLPMLGPADVIPQGFEPIRFLPGQLNPPPAIRWGELFDDIDDQGNPNPKQMPMPWRLRRAQLVASAMNHAAAVAQRQLAEWITRAQHQEKLLDQWQERWSERDDINTGLLAREQAAKQERLQEMQRLKAENHRLRKELTKLRAEG